MGSAREKPDVVQESLFFSLELLQNNIKQWKTSGLELGWWSSYF